MLDSCYTLHSLGPGTGPVVSVIMDSRLWIEETVEYYATHWIQLQALDWKRVFVVIVVIDYRLGSDALCYCITGSRSRNQVCTHLPVSCRDVNSSYHLVNIAMQPAISVCVSLPSELGPLPQLIQ
jgi:hypothetical protein